MPRNNWRKQQYLLGISGEPLEDMKRTLLATLDRLPKEGLSINLVGFGSTFERLFVDSQPTSDPRTIPTARNYIEQIAANYGGTELWYSSPPYISAGVLTPYQASAKGGAPPLA